MIMNDPLRPDPHAQSLIGNVLKTYHQQAFFNTYWKMFEVVHADTDELRRAVFALRYQVYCRENNFIDPALHPDRLESDAYDEHSSHFLLIRQKDGLAVGTVRVTFPHEEKIRNSFQMQKLVDHPLLHQPEQVDTLFEMSRFCFISSFRQRVRDGHLLPVYYEQEWNQGEISKALSLFRRRVPYAPLGLMMAAFEAALDKGYTNGITMMESRQFNTIRRLGMDYRVLGPRCVHHGSQQPLLFNIKSAFDSMAIANPECWDIISDKGRLHRRANQIYQKDWHDTLFDDVHPRSVVQQLL